MSGERKEILSKAVHLTCGERNDVYGDPVVNLTHTAGLWTAYAAGKTMFTAEDVAHMMQLLKMSRAVTGQYHPDNYYDNTAYAAIAGECAARAAA